MRHIPERALTRGLAASLLVIGLHAGAASAAATDLHGAMPVAAQEKRLDALKTGDGSKPPVRIDPTIWVSIVPADNAVTPERVALGRKLYFDTPALAPTAPSPARPATTSAADSPTSGRSPRASAISSDGATRRRR